MTEDKVTLTRKRAELVATLTPLLPREDRVRIEGEITVINAKIKAQNKTEAARNKTTADRRKAVGLAEAQANAARALAKVNGGAPTEDEDPIDQNDDDDDDDPGQTAAIDGWIDAVLLRHDVEFTRTKNGTLKITINEASKLEGVVFLLIKGVYAAARGEELPDLPSAAPNAAKAAKAKKRSGG